MQSLAFSWSTHTPTSANGVYPQYFSFDSMVFAYCAETIIFVAFYFKRLFSFKCVSWLPIEK